MKGRRQLKSYICQFLVAVMLMTNMPSYAQMSLNLPTLGDTDSASLSPVSERLLGERIMRSARQDPSYIQDETFKAYLNQFGQHLVDSEPSVRGQANFDFYFFAVKDPSLNAFALPGGFVGVHTGLLLAAQTESELAGVLAHEIGHVAQRHIARMLGQQKQNTLLQMAGFFLGIIAATATIDGGMATMMGTMGLARQRQLSFSRDAERDADRVGLQIMDKGGFDPSGMVAFFRRLQTANRAYGDVPAFLSSHPLTSERIADIEDRIRNVRYRQHADQLDFQLMRARVRVLQDDSGRALENARLFFTDQATSFNTLDKMSANYGLAYIALKQEKYDQAQHYLALSQGYVPTSSNSFFLTQLQIDILLAQGDVQAVLEKIKVAQSQFSSRVFDYQYAHALIDLKQYDQAIHFLRSQAQTYRKDPQIHYLLAQIYDTQGKRALQHLALAENYALKGILPSAIEQLDIARLMTDATFYDLSTIDAKDRQFKDQWALEQQQDKEFL